MAINNFAKIGDGALLSLGPTTVTTISSAEVVTNYTNLAQVRSGSLPIGRAEARVTHWQSKFKDQYIPAHADITARFTLNLLPYATAYATNALDGGADFPDLLLIHEPTTGTPVNRAWLLQVPSGDTSDTLYAWAFFGFITQLEPSIDVDNPNSLELALRVPDSIIVAQQ